MSDYHIYICKPSSKYFEQEIKNRKFDKQGVHVCMEENNAKIVIPLANDWYNIESQLFDWKMNSDIPEVKIAGFWGQYSSCH